jgi:hypothetical protein
MNRGAFWTASLIALAPATLSAEPKPATGPATPAAHPKAMPAPSASPAAPATSTATATAPASASAAATAAPTDFGTCVEHVPIGKARPQIIESIAARGTSGHAVLLKLVIEHGPGETVLPSGFHVKSGSDEFKALEASHFFFPDPNGDAHPTLERSEANGQAKTTVKLWFVPLPPKPGRNQLTLPPLPIAVSRKSGELMTLCTSPHQVLLEEPTANDPNPKPKPNPPPRKQREEWVAARQVTYAALIALVAGALLATLIQIWRRRPKPLPPPVPSRPAWEVALESLHDLRHSGLLDEQRFAEFYDRASDVLRKYLGDHFGYDGLESTTREALTALRRIAMPLDVWVSVQEFMQDADLVKFARRTPTEAECRSVLERAEDLVTKTRPVAPPPLEPPTPPAPESPVAPPPAGGNP